MALPIEGEMPKGQRGSVDMKKKEYIVPECEIIELEVMTMIATSPNFELDNEEEVNDPGSLSNRYRGEWGNLWGSRK